MTPQSNAVAAIMSVLFLSGCALKPVTPEVKIEEVVVPIEQPCLVEMPTAPNYKFGTLKISDDLDDKVRALLHDRVLHLAYERELAAALKACQ